MPRRGTCSGSTSWLEPDDGCSVRIGGEECPYTSVSTLVSGLPQGDWRKIIDVEVPLSEFGGPV